MAQQYISGQNGPNQPWVALSGKGLIAPDMHGLTQGLFVVEFALPLPSGSVLLAHHSDHGKPRSFAIFYDASAGFSILIRNGEMVQRCAIAGTMAAQGGVARLSFGFDAAAAHWAAQVEHLGGLAPSLKASGAGSLAIDAQEADLICKMAQHHAQVLWFGFGRSMTLPKSAPWIGQRTPVETSLGFVAAGNLRAGDIIMTADHGPVMLRALHRLDLPARGSFAPILLRAPYYDGTHDLLVSANQKLVMAGGAVEYLFGTDAVTVLASELVDGRTALADDRRSVMTGVSLDFGRSAQINTGDMQLEMGTSDDDSLPSLSPYEVVTLMAMMGRAVSRVA